MQWYEFDPMDHDLKQAFGVALDERADQLETIRDLVHHLDERLRCQDNHVTLFRACIFDRLRENFPDKTEIISPATPTSKLFPLPRRRLRWSQLERALDLNMPPLRFSSDSSVGIVLVIAFGAILLIGRVYPSGLHTFFDLPEILVISPMVIVGLLTYYVFYRYARFLNFNLPESCETLEGLVDKIIEVNAVNLHRELVPEQGESDVDPFIAPRERHTFVAAFFELRRMVALCANIPSRTIKLDTPLNKLFPADIRRRLWQRISDQSGYELPPLQRPRWLVALCFVLFLLSLTWILKISVWTWWDATGPALAYGMLYTYVAHFATKPLAVCLPQNCETMGQLTNEVIVRNYGKIARSNGSVHAVEIWRVLEEIIVREGEYPPGEITLESPLTELED